MDEVAAIPPLPTAETTDPAAAIPPKPRVWTVFLALFVALVAAGIFQVIAGVVLILLATAQGANPNVAADQLLESLTTPAMFMLIAGCAQLAFALAVLFPAWLSPVPMRERLGLFSARPNAHIYPLAMLGALIPLALGVAVAESLTSILPGDLSVEALYRHMTPVIALPFLLFIAFVPGVVEELLFRGYIQRRLLQRWSPAWAIGVTSLLFALVHVTPLAVVALFPLGVWLGVVAWRTGSVLPSILCHAFVNGSVNAWRMVVKFADVQQGMQLASVVVILLVCLVCFILAVRMMARQPPPSVGQNAVAGTAEASGRPA